MTILAYQARTGGAISVSKNILASLGRVAPDVSYQLFVPSGCGFGPVCEQFRYHQTTYCEAMSKLARWSWSVRNLPAMVQEFEPHLVLGLGNMGLLKPPCPQAILVHRAQLFYPPGSYAPDTPMRNLMVRCRRRYLKKTLRKTQLILCQTAVAEKRIRATYGFSGPMHLLPNAVSQYVVAGDFASGMPEPFRPHLDRFRLLCLSVYRAHKNLESLVGLFERYREELKDVVVFLTIAADQHPYAKRLLDSIQSRGLQDHIVNLGPIAQEDLAGYYRNCQGLLLPTTLESFSETYLEAMRFGTPILTSDMDFAHEVCGDAALYFDPRDSHSINEAILRLKKEPGLAQSLTEKGEAVLRANYRSWDEIVEPVFETLFDLAARS